MLLTTTRIPLAGRATGNTNNASCLGGFLGVQSCIHALGYMCTCFNWGPQDLACTYVQPFSMSILQQCINYCVIIIIHYYTLYRSIIAHTLLWHWTWALKSIFGIFRIVDDILLVSHEFWCSKLTTISRMTLNGGVFLSSSFQILVKCLQFHSQCHQLPSAGGTKEKHFHNMVHIVIGVGEGHQSSISNGRLEFCHTIGTITYI